MNVGAALVAGSADRIDDVVSGCGPERARAQFSNRSFAETVSVTSKCRLVPGVNASPRDLARQRVGRNLVARPFRAVGSDGLDLDGRCGAEDGRGVVDTHGPEGAAVPRLITRVRHGDRRSRGRGAASLGDPELRLAGMFRGARWSAQASLSARSLSPGTGSSLGAAGDACADGRRQRRPTPNRADAPGTSTIPGCRSGLPRSVPHRSPTAARGRGPTRSARRSGSCRGHRQRAA